MDKTTKVTLVVVVAAIIIVGGIWLLMQNTASDTSTSQQDSSSSQTAIEPEQESVTITYGDNGFEPSEVTVKMGTTVKFVNQSSEDIEVKSNPHPGHSDNTELNIGDIHVGEDATFQPTIAGAWGYHNHYKPEATATIIVE